MGVGWRGYCDWIALAISQVPDLLGAFVPVGVAQLAGWLVITQASLLSRSRIVIKFQPSSPG